MHEKRLKIEQMSILAAPLAIALLSMVIVSSGMSATKVAVFFLAAAIGVLIVTIPPTYGLFCLLAYLFFEGMIKVLSNYNPILHVASDGLLILTFIRMYFSHRLVTPEGTAQVVHWMFLYWMWILVQFFNPWGLGLLPSLAALKVYIVPTLAFFIVARLIPREHLKWIPLAIVGLGLFEATVAITDWMLGDQVLPKLHGRYQDLIRLRFSGTLYRPFGTSFAPGGPSLLIYLTAPAVLLVFALRKAYPKIWMGRLSLMYLPFALGGLLVCQVRTMMLRFMAILVAGLVASKNRTALTSLFLCGGLAAAAFSQIDVQYYQSLSPHEMTAWERVVSRFVTLSDQKTYKEARSGSLALKRVEHLSQYTVFGIGLSRTGAMSGLWEQRRREDPVLSPNWAFTDNAYLMLFTELGVIGVLAFIAMKLGIAMTLFRRGTFASRSVGAYVLIVLVAGLGSEEIMYAPGSTFEWIYIALGLRLGEDGL